MRTIALVLVASLFVVGACKDEKKEQRDKLAPICQRATDALGENEGMDSKTFMLNVENALKACSAACDAEDETSCGHLEDHLGILCKTSPDICSSFCSEAKGSLKEMACKAAGA